MKDLIHQVQRFAGRLLLLTGALVAGRASADDSTCYVESAKSTYVETDYFPGPDTRIEFDFQFNSATVQYRAFGVQDPDTMSCNLYINGNGPFAYVFKDGSPSGVMMSSTSQRADTVRHTVILDSYNSTWCLKTGTETTYSGTITTTRTKRSAYPLHFFAENNRTVEVNGSYANMKFYGCKIYEKGELVRDYVPCVRNGFVGIKDQLTGNFFFPKDYNTLTAGAGVVPETTTDGYLESSGSAYLDTGYLPTPNTRMEVDFEMTSVERAADTYPRIFGSNGLRYEAYLNSANQFSLSAYDAVKGPTKNAAGQVLNGFQTATGYRADVGVRHTIYIDHYRMRASLLSANATSVSKQFALAAPMTNGTVTAANQSLLVFAGRYDTAHFVKARLYGLRIYESGLLVRDYVPCLQEDAKGLYDTVTGQFVKYEAGTLGGNYLVREEQAYVESTANTYVETDYYPNPDTRIEADFRFVQTNLQSRVFSVLAPSTLSCTLYINAANRFGYVCRDGSGGVDPGIKSDMDRHTAILDSYNSKFYLLSGPTTNYNLNVTTTRTKQSQYPIFFFGENQAELKRAEAMNARMRFYGCKIYEKGELVRDYVPCVRNGFVGIKDQLTGNFFFPKDYSPLTAGPGTLRETTTDGYLESTGSDYLDTGYKPTPNTRIDIDFEMVSTNRADNTYPRLFGSDGLRYESYLNSANQFAFSAWDSANRLQQDAKGNNYVGFQTGTGYKADAGVRHTLYVDHYRLRGALTTPDPAVNTSRFALTTPMNGTVASKSLLIFSGYGTSGYMYTKMKLYSFRIYESDVLVRDYVPCVKDCVSGLYDRVTGEFLGYACGSVGGDVMIDGTDACIVSDGTQGILSDYYANPGSKIVVDFSFNEVATKGQRLFSAEACGDANYPFSCQTYLNGNGYFAYSFCDGLANYTQLLDGGKAVAGTRYAMTLDGPNDKVSVKGGATDISADITTTRTKTASNPLGILMNYKNGFTHTGASIRLYSLKCYDNGVLAHYYLPYKSGDTIGLYDTVTGKVFVNTKSGANPLRIEGMGTDGSGSALLVTPKDTRAKWIKPAVLKAFAPGAIAYRWFEGDTEIVGETGAELRVARQEGRKLVTYSVKPVFMVNGERIEGEAASATVDHTVIGMRILVK